MRFSIKMRINFFQEIEIPEGVSVELHKDILKVKGSQGENERHLVLRGLEFKIDGKKIIFGCKKTTKKEKKRINTMKAHIANLIGGVNEKYEYKLKACFVHFPVTLEHKGHEVIIKNFLGEKTPRKAKIPKGAEVKIEKDIIKVTSTNKEIAGQAAANLETATKIRKRDRRVFQDGIFITSKCGEEI